MKYVTRPAPPPPNSASSAQQQQSNVITSISSQMAKPKPPRPPPPRAALPQTDNKSYKEPMKIFSNLFGGKKSKSGEIKNSNNMEVRLPPPPKLPAPPVTFVPFATRPSTAFPVHKSDVQLINFNESPPSSPVVFIKKSNTGGSDSVSIDSFCSTNSSPHNFNSGTQSQAERYEHDNFILIEI